MPEVIATGLSGHKLLADATGLYWLSGFNGDIMHANLDGSAVMLLKNAGFSINQPTFTMCGNDLAFSGGPKQGMYRLPKSGAGQPAQEGLGIPNYATCYLNTLYWTAFEGLNTSTVRNKTGVLTSGLYAPQGLHIDASGIYVNDTNTIKRCAINGGASSTIVSQANNADGLTFAQQKFYWWGGNNFVLYTVPQVGGQPLPIGSVGWYAYMVADAQNLYIWDTQMANGTIGDIYKMPLGGGPKTTLATSVSFAGMAVHGNYLYWISVPPGTITRLSLQ